MTIEDMAGKLQELQVKFTEVYQDKLPKEVGGFTEGAFAANFPQQGFNTGSGIETWEPLKKPQDRLTLVKTGKGLEDVSNSARDPIITDESVTVPFEVDDDYMNYHNIGNEHLPVRQFSGESELLIEGIMNVIEKNLEILEV